MFSTHFRGKITELEVANNFLRLGYQVCEPLVGDSRYDFIVDIENALYRIQVKTATLSADKDYIEFKTQSTHNNTKRTMYRTYSRNEVDYFATVHNGQCYIVPINKIGTRSFRLRLTQTKNNQAQNVNFAKDFTIDNIFASGR